MFERFWQPWARRGVKPASAALRLEAVPRPAPRPAEVSAPAATDAEPCAVFAWLLRAPPPLPGPLAPAEQRLLATLDRRITAPELPPDLLPRAASVIPQLIALLRREQPPREALVAQIVKDPQLTAEVLRMAHSVHYGGRAHGTLEAAIDRIGTAGLQAAMARVLLRPVFVASGPGLLARSGERVWQLAEYKSLLCAQLVREQQGDGFEGFLAGLLHDTGTLGLLRLLDRDRSMPTLPLSVACEAALRPRRDRLFGRLAAAWDLSPALTRLAHHLGRERADERPPLAQLLRQADDCALADLARVPAAAR